MKPQTYSLTWRGVRIAATFNPRRWKTISHLELRSVEPHGAPLPVTSTGYVSHFMQPGSLEETGKDVVAFVTEWLDEEAESPDWLAHVEASRQLSLF